MSYQAIVIGAGLSGAVMAERMASQLGWKVLVLEQRDHIGGNCFDEYDEHGVLIHRYGPHLFHTDSKVVWDYLSQFTEWLPYEHRVLSRIDGQLVPIPFNLTSIERCFPADKAGAMIEALRIRFGDGARVPILELRKEQDPLLGELADFIYRKAFVNYTSKQWGVPPEQISPEVTARVPVVVSRDDRYFTDPWQAVPAAGYTAMFEQMLAHPLIDVRLSTPMAQHVRLDWQQKLVLLDGEQFDGPLIYTGMLDHLLPAEGNYLPYRSLRFEHRHLAQEQFQPVTTVNYPNEEAFTRITEFKHFSGQVHPGTSIVYEYPCDYQPEQGLEPYYPLFTDAAKQHYQACRDELTRFPQLIALGRLAEYRYFDMDDAVNNALHQFDLFLKRQTVDTVSRPMLTALMTTYNTAPYVRATIDSVLAQSFTDFELVIVDDGSSDETVDVIRSYQDSRIRLYCREENKGIGYSLQEALQYVHSPYVIKVDADDLSHPERFARQLEALQVDTGLALVKCYIEAFAESDDADTTERLATRQRDYAAANLINTESLISQNLPRWLCVEHTSYCARTDAILAVGYPDQRLCEDYSLFYRLNEQGYRIGCVKETLVKVRVNRQSVTAQVNNERLLSWFTHLFNFKQARIMQLIGDAEGVAIYGSGGLARLMYQIFRQNNIAVLNFIEQSEKPPVHINGIDISVKALRDCLQQKIVVAAQPVRLEMIEQLTNLGLTEWCDFMVIA